MKTWRFFRDVFSKQSWCDQCFHVVEAVLVRAPVLRCQLANWWLGQNCSAKRQSGAHTGASVVVFC